MDYIFLAVIIFLFLLAVFDLTVGVSNDAVNFMTSAIGAKAAGFKTVIVIASAGVFVGACMSNGMMDIARHGIFRPEQFSFYELMCVFMAVMVTDIILLDVFNSLSMPTSTTVSLVFELLGATFILSIFKMSGAESDLRFDQLLNTEKALSVTIGIFLSVAVAFVFGTVVQFISRMIFTFDYRRRLKWLAGLFGGLCVTAIIYFLLIKGLSCSVLMTDQLNNFIAQHSLEIVAICFVVSTIVMQLLYMIGVNVLKIVVLLGTFALAMAFAGNDLVNFIGVPLTGLSSYQDYMANGGGDARGFMMASLNAPADTPVYFLIGAGAIMVAALAGSKKARAVTQTTINLGSRSSADEMFGSSRIGRRIVRLSLSAIAAVRHLLPLSVRRWFARRFDVDTQQLPDGASFDLLRGAVNLVLAGALIAAGTSMKLPLSTTFVTFMVAMGTSLADRAWSRESAVFRVTGVISVIGGWFITAGVAFIGAALVVSAMYWGGGVVIIALSVVTLFVLFKSNRRFKQSKDKHQGEVLFETIINNDDKSQNWPLLEVYILENQRNFLKFASLSYIGISSGFISDDIGQINKIDRSLDKEKAMLKYIRRKETLCLREVVKSTAIEKSAWFHLAANCCMSMLYNLKRINEGCSEHVDNNFLPLPSDCAQEYTALTANVVSLINRAESVIAHGTIEEITELRKSCENFKTEVSDAYHRLYEKIGEDDSSTMTVLYVYLNVLQETREMISSLRKLLRASMKLKE